MAFMFAIFDLIHAVEPQTGQCGTSINLADCKLPRLPSVIFCYTGAYIGAIILLPL